MTTFNIFHTTRVRIGVRDAPHIWGAGEIRDAGERRLFGGLARSEPFVTPHVWGTGEMSTEISATYLGRCGNKHCKSRRIYVALGHNELMEHLPVFPFSLCCCHPLCFTLWVEMIMCLTYFCLDLLSVAFSDELMTNTDLKSTLWFYDGNRTIKCSTSEILHFNFFIFEEPLKTLLYNSQEDRIKKIFLWCYCSLLHIGKMWSNHGLIQNIKYVACILEW